MTVSSSNRKAGPFLGNGVTTAFPFTFKVFKKEDITVTYTDANGVDATLTLDSQYSVALNSDQDVSPGGTITYPTVASGLPILPTGQKLTLTGGLAYTQPTALPNLGPFFAQTVEDALDRAEIQIQQVKEITDRAITISVSDTPLTPLPAAAARANELIGFDSLGNVTLYPVTASVGAGDMRVDTFTAGIDFIPGVTTSLVLSRPPGTAANAEVFFDPLYQGPDQWSVAGSTLTFTGPIPVGVSKVFVRLGTTLSVYLPPPGSVGTAQLIDGSVTDAKVAAGSMLYNRIHDIFDVKDYGAVGDGVNDDTAEIQAAINAMTAGGILLFPAGNYKISGTLNAKSNTLYLGRGATITQTANNTRIFSCVNLTNIAFDGLTLAGVGYSDTASTLSSSVFGNAAFAIGIYLTGCTFVDIRNCTFQNFLNAAIASAYHNYITISNNKIIGTFQGPSDAKTPVGNGSYAAFGVLLYAGNSTLVPSGFGNIKVVNNAINTTCHGVFTGPGYTNILVSGNSISNLAQHGCYLNPGTNLVCNENQISAFYGDGIKVQSTSVAMFYNPIGVVVSDNVITNAPNGIWGIIIDVITGAGDIYTSLITESVSITGNVLYNSGSGGIYAGHCRHLQIADNALTSIGGLGIQLLSSQGVVTKNLLTSIFGIGINVTPELTSYVEISDNSISGCGIASATAYISFTTANNPYAWTASTNFGAGVYCSNGGNVYVSTNSGISGLATGPTGTGSGIADGTVLWNYVSSLAAANRGGIQMMRNYVTSTPNDAVAYAVFAGGTGLGLYMKDNVFPRVNPSGAPLAVNLGASQAVGDDNNMHGGYSVLPAAVGPIPGHAFRQFTGSAPPGAGTYQAGDIVWNVAPTAGTNIGWVCVANGVPGTWKTFGAIAA